MANTAPPKLIGFKNPGDDPGNLDLATTTVTTSTGANDAFKYVTSGANGLIDPTLIDGTQYGKPDVQMGVVVGDTLAAGDLVNMFLDNSTGTPRNGVRLANSTSYGSRMMGFVQAAAGPGDTVKVYKSGLNASVTGLTIGQAWLSATPGKSTATPPTAGISQKVGNASSATTLHTQIGPAFGL